MKDFEGNVALDGNRVPVVVSIEGSRLRLTSNGSLIGDWPAGEYELVDLGSGAFSIEAEGETLRFLPSEPERFAEILDNVSETPVSLVETTASAEAEPPDTSGWDDLTDVGLDMAPPRVDTPPAASTAALAGLYALSALTLGLAVWALMRMLA